MVNKTAGPPLFPQLIDAVYDATVALLTPVKDTLENIDEWIVNGDTQAIASMAMKSIAEAGPSILMAASERVVDTACAVFERKRRCHVLGHTRIALKAGAIVSVALATGGSVVPYVTVRAISVLVRRTIRRVSEVVEAG